MAVENRNDGRMMFIAIFIAFSLLISTHCFTALKHNSLGDILNDDTVNVSYFSFSRNCSKLYSELIVLCAHY